LATFTDRRPPLDHPAPTHPENTPGEQEQQRPRQGVAGADDACRFVRMPQTAPLAGNLRDTRTSGRPVMGQLSPKKVLDDARPTERPLQYGVGIPTLLQGRASRRSHLSDSPVRSHDRRLRGNHSNGRLILG
jgi:hypothetical protein